MSKQGIMRISRGGQVTVPAPVRRRWGTDRIAVEDRGDHLVLRPLPDPIEAFEGFAADAAAAQGLRSEDLRARARAEDRAVGRRRR
jgi:bifunctional DNA-binding transcriptional regulator/antitoxin component of YhaV-PrlF toxin-antitoxin module